MTLRFGTDGVRGVANVDLTPELALALGRAAVRVLPTPRLVIGRDTRRSGAMLEGALAAGAASEGVAVELLGVVPTPVVAHHADQHQVVGAVISASHNPYGDNGIKLFAPGGRKLSDELEARLEAELDAVLRGSAVAPPPVGVAVGAVGPHPEPSDDWMEHVVRATEGRRLGGLRVVVDCANGSASTVAGPLLERLGARVELTHHLPDGVNINDGCGSTHPQSLAATVVHTGAAVGVALDGDADRVLLVDALGNVVDGDQIIAMSALDLRARGKLFQDTVVVTVMTNLGFKQAMVAAGIRVVETDVGDRNVLEALDVGGWSLGGEQSGHVIFGDLSTTGDGLLTAVVALDLLARDGRPLAQVAAEAMSRLPQVLRSVRVRGQGARVVEAVAQEIHDAGEALGDRGRVLIRPSGTEPVVRVMVEAPTESEAASVADALVGAVERAGAP